MNLIILILVVLAVGIVVGYVLARHRKGGAGRGLIENQVEEKQKNKKAILGLLESGNSPLTNDHVEKMLGISDATATRYLDELEKEGKVIQHGETGQSVFYTLK